VRGALFPNNLPAGKSTLVAPASDAELRALRRRCASALWALVPKGVGRLYFGGGLLRASPISRASEGSKTEGSAEQLKTASNNDSGRDKGKGSNKDEVELDDGNSDKDKGLAALSSSSSSSEQKEKARRRRIETVTSTPEAADQQAAAAAARGQERPRPAGSPRSRRSAPAPRPKTGGQGPALPNAPSTAAPASISAGGEASSGMASTLAGGLTHGDEKGQRRRQRKRRDRDHAQDHDRDDDDNDNDGDDDDDDEAILGEIERGVLDVFGDAYCNKHLVYSILELILVRLLPELTDKGVLELWGERVPVDGP